MPNRVRKLSRVAPELAGRLDILATTLKDAVERLPEATETLIHGDCHPDQVWLHGDRVVLFDFDEFALGNPMEDLAEFTIKLEQTTLPAELCKRYVEALLDGYRSSEPGFFHAGWLKWHQTVQALLQTSRAFGYQAPGWRKLVDSRLSVCEAHAASLSSGVTA